MISTTSISRGNFGTVAPERQFELDPPSSNTFIPSARVFFVQDTGRLILRWAENDLSGAITDSSERILQEILDRADRAVDRFERSARAHTNRGLALLNLGDLDSAALAFSKALELIPNHYVASLNLARVYVLKGQFDQAEDLYLEMRRLYPADPAPLISIAYISMRRENFAKAAQELRDLLRVDQTSALARYQLAIVLLVQGKPQEAIAQLRLALSRDVRSAAVHQALAVAYTVAGDLRRAARSFQAALTLDPGMPEATHGLSQILLRSGDAEKASLVLIAYLERRPGDLQARETLAQSYKELKRFGASRAQLFELLREVRQLKNRGVDVKNWEARILNNIGACFAFESSFSDAEKWFKSALELNPENYRAPYQNLARVLLRADRVLEARNVMELCHSRFPIDAETVELLVLCYEKESRYEESITELERVISAGQATERTYAILGAFLADAKRDLETAASVLKKGYELFPKSIDISNNLAYVRLLRGDVAGARSILTELPPTAFENVYLTCTRGLLYIWEGDVERGTAQYLEAEAIARRAGNSVLAQRVLQKMHLEVARAFVRRGDESMALREAERGSKIRDEKSPYSQDLSDLLQKLRGDAEAGSKD
jgi:tetratricopeptide (TPR) repeat protein